MFISSSQSPHVRRHNKQDRSRDLPKTETKPAQEEKGYNEDFLDIRLDLPQVDEAYQDQIAPLKDDPSKSENTTFSRSFKKFEGFSLAAATLITEG